MNEPFANTLKRALDHSLRHLESLDTSPVDATRDLATVRRQLMKPLGAGPLPAAQVIDELVADAAGGLIGCAGGRFFAWVVGGALSASLAADWMTAAWEQNAGLDASGPAAAIAEEGCGTWLKELLRHSGKALVSPRHGLPDGSRDVPRGGAAVGAETAGWDVESARPVRRPRHSGRLRLRAPRDVVRSARLLGGRRSASIIEICRGRGRSGCAPARWRRNWTAQRGARRSWCCRRAN